MIRMLRINLEELFHMALVTQPNLQYFNLDSLKPQETKLLIHNGNVKCNEKAAMH